MQLRHHTSGLLYLQAGAEQVGEQVVVAPPAAHLIQRDQEQARPLGLLQQRLAALAAGDGVAQRAAEPLQHRGFQQERAHLLALELQHFLGQVVQDVPVAAGERGHERGGIVVSAQSARPAATGRPALGPGRQRRHGGIGQGRARPGRHLLQQGRRLANVNRSSASRSSAESTRAQRASASGGSLRLARPRISRRPVLEKETERLVHGLRANHVVVIEDQEHLVVTRRGGELVNQGRHHGSNDDGAGGRATGRPVR